MFSRLQFFQKRCFWIIVSFYEVSFWKGIDMIEKLDWVHPRLEEVGMLLSDPEVVKDQKRWQQLVREHARLEP